MIRAIETLVEKLREHNATIYVRRGGPNYQGGLRKLKETGMRNFNHPLTIPRKYFSRET